MQKKEYKIKGNSIKVEDGKVFIFDDNKPMAKNIRNVFIYHKVGYENNKRKYFLTGSIGFLDSKHNIAAFHGVEKIILNEKSNSIEVFILI